MAIIRHTKLGMLTITILMDQKKLKPGYQYTYGEDKLKRDCQYTYRPNKINTYKIYLYKN